MTTVIVPALNEENTIGPLIDQLTQVINMDIANVIVVIDPETTDATAENAAAEFAHVGMGMVMHSTDHGKGQCVNTGLQIVPSSKNEICFCDADVTMTNSAVRDLYTPLDVSPVRTGQRIIIPRMPSMKEWLKATEDSNLTFRPETWSAMSGIRRVRRNLIPPNLYGYLMESQINQSVRRNMWDTEYCHHTDVISPLRMTAQRVADLKAHGQYGKAHGIL